MFQLIEAYYFWEILKLSKESLNIVDFSYVTFFLQRNRPMVYQVKIEPKTILLIPDLLFNCTCTLPVLSMWSHDYNVPGQLHYSDDT